MFKHDKIRKFIEKYGWELSNNDFTQLEDFLNKIPKITSIMKKINKLSGKEKEYLLVTIDNYKKYHYTDVDVYIILNDKINLIKNNKNGFKYPDLDRVYYAFKSSGTIYDLFLADYIKRKQENDDTNITLTSYCDVIEKNYIQIHDIVKHFCNKNYELEDFKRQIYSLTPRCFNAFFGYAKENKLSLEQKCQFLNFISREDCDFSKLSVSDFRDVLKFVFSSKNQVRQKSILENKLSIVSYYINDLYNDKMYLSILNDLPYDYIQGIFVEKEVYYDDNFLHLLKESDIDTSSRIIEFIGKVKSHYNDEYYKVLNSNEFTKVSSDTIKLVLEKIEEISDEDYIRKQEKISFIMESLILDDKDFISSSWDFINEDQDYKLTSTRINCVKNIIPHIYSGEISVYDCNKYLEIFNYGLEEMSQEQKLDVLEARIKYFETTNAYNKLEILNKSAFELLVSDDERIFDYINNSNNYSEEVNNSIMNNISKLDKKRKSECIDFIVDEFFTNSDDRRQKELLELFRINDVSVDFGENKESVVEVSPYVHKIVTNSDNPLEFVNRDTNMKIFVKTTKKD